MHLDHFGYSLTAEYIFSFLGLLKQLLLASKLVPYYPILSLNTPFYGTVPLAPRANRENGC